MKIRYTAIPILIGSLAVPAVPADAVPGYGPRVTLMLVRERLGDPDDYIYLRWRQSIRGRNSTFGAPVPATVRVETIRWPLTVNNLYAPVRMKSRVVLRDDSGVKYRETKTVRVPPRGFRYKRWPFGTVVLGEGARAAITYWVRDSGMTSWMKIGTSRWHSRHAAKVVR